MQYFSRLCAKHDRSISWFSMYLNNHWLVHSKRSARLLEGWVIQKGYDLKILPGYWETFSKLFSTMLSSRQHNFLTGTEIFYVRRRISGISLALRTSLPQLQKGSSETLLNLRAISEDGSDVQWDSWAGDQKIKHLDRYCLRYHV